MANGWHEIDKTAVVLADSAGLTVSGSGTLAFGSSSSITDNGAGLKLIMDGAGGTLTPAAATVMAAARLWRPARWWRPVPPPFPPEGA